MEIVPKTSKSQSILTLTLITFGIIVLVLFISNEMEAVQEFIRNSGWIGLFISIALYGVLGLSPIPSEPLTVLLSTVYGPLAATMVSGAGNLLAAIVEYFLGERIGNIASFEERKDSLPFGLGKFPVNSVPFLLLARMLPGYGPKFVSVISGVYRVPMVRYIWTAAIPTFLGSALFAYGGFELLNRFFLKASF